MKLSDVQMGGRLMVLLKGETGSGKTGVMGSFAGKTYSFDFDGRIKSLLRTHPDRVKDIEFDVYSQGNFRDFLDNFEALQDRCPWDNVHIGSLTTLALSSIAFFKNARGRGGKIRGGVRLADIEDYGGESTILQQIMEIAKTLKCNFFLEAHVVEWTDTNIETKTTTHSRQLMTGGKKIAAAIPAFFDEIWHCQVERPINADEKGPQFYVLTSHTGEDYARSALPLPSRINQTNKNFYDLLQGYMKDWNEKQVEESKVIKV